MILYLLFISFVINFYSILYIKWYDDYYKSVEKLCINKYNPELYTYRYNIYKLLFNIDSNVFNNLYNIFNFFYYISVFFIIIIIMSLYKDYNEINMNVYIFTIIFLLYIFIFYSISIAFNKLINVKYDNKNVLNTYAKLYSNLNGIFYSKIINEPILYDSSQPEIKISPNTLQLTYLYIWDDNTDVNKSKSDFDKYIIANCIGGTNLIPAVPVPDANNNDNNTIIFYNYHILLIYDKNNTDFIIHNTTYNIPPPSTPSYITTGTYKILKNYNLIHYDKYSYYNDINNINFKKVGLYIANYNTFYIIFKVYYKVNILTFEYVYCNIYPITPELAFETIFENAKTAFETPKNIFETAKKNYEIINKLKEYVNNYINNKPNKDDFKNVEFYCYTYNDIKTDDKNKFYKNINNDNKYDIFKNYIITYNNSNDLKEVNTVINEDFNNFDFMKYFIINDKFIKNMNHYNDNDTSLSPLFYYNKLFNRDFLDLDNLKICINKNTIDKLISDINSITTPTNNNYITNIIVNNTNLITSIPPPITTPPTTPTYYISIKCLNYIKQNPNYYIENGINSATQFIIDDIYNKIIKEAKITNKEGLKFIYDNYKLLLKDDFFNDKFKMHINMILKYIIYLFIIFIYLLYLILHSIYEYVNDYNYTMLLVMILLITIAIVTLYYKFLYGFV